MAVLYSNDSAGLGTVPSSNVNGGVIGGRVRRYRAAITLASQATTDTIVIGRVPAGSVFAYGVINTDTSLSTSTVAIGVTGATGKYRAAAVFTATNTPTVFGPAAAAFAAPLTADEEVFITIAVAALPAAGNLVVDLYFSAP
jgi:hypothetical protein